MMNKVLETTKHVVDNSQHVKINRNNAEKFCRNLDLDALRTAAEGTLFDLPGQEDGKRVDFAFLINSLNFCYWGDPKWTVDVDGKKSDGAMGMDAALKRAINSGVPILDA
jgi:hypothetical protein